MAEHRSSIKLLDAILATKQRSNDCGVSNEEFVGFKRWQTFTIWGGLGWRERENGGRSRMHFQAVIGVGCDQGGAGGGWGGWFENYLAVKESVWFHRIDQWSTSVFSLLTNVQADVEDTHGSLHFHKWRTCMRWLWMYPWCSNWHSSGLGLGKWSRAQGLWMHPQHPEWLDQSSWPVESGKESWGKKKEKFSALG